MNYRENARSMGERGVNLTRAGYLFNVYARGLDDKTRDAIDDMYGFGGEFGFGQETALMTEDEIDRCEVPYDAVDWEGALFFEEDRDAILSKLLKDAGHYLVLANNVRWDGASGYKFAQTREGAFSRSYDANIYPKSASKGGKVLITRECSHDVPMGARTTVIALTETEYMLLRYADDEKIFAFAEKMEKAAEEA